MPDGVGHLSLGFLLIDATRYNLSRPGAAAIGYAQALAKTLPQIAPHVRRQLVQDIERVLRVDKAARELIKQANALEWEPREPLQPRHSIFVGYADVRLAWEQLVQASYGLPDKIDSLES